MPEGRSHSLSDDLAGRLRGAGRDAGLAALGFTTADPFPQTREVLERRRAAGLAATMQFTYRNPARSTEPGRILPGARSLVVGAYAYERRAPETEAPPVGAAVARFAWSDHYAALRSALEAVAGVARAEGWRAAVVADDNALVDRAAAVRAGLGWYGKNSNVLLPGAGSWFVLGSIVTDAPLPPGEVVADGCGRCRRCLTACPTGALVGPGVLDARRCLAWLVQAGGVFPTEYREALGDRLYGCDDCQEACPPNRANTRQRLPPVAPAASASVVDVLELLASDDATLLDRFGRWYLAGRQVRWLRRNALIVLGNTAAAETPGVVEALTRALADRDPAVRGPAVWAAARLGLPDLLDALAGDTDPEVAAELAAAGSVRPRD